MERFLFKTPKKIDYEFVKLGVGTYDLVSLYGHVQDISLSLYRIGKYEVAVVQYVQYLNALNVGDDGLHKVKQMLGDSFGDIEFFKACFRAKKGYELEPIVQVTYYVAQAYCKWLGANLPTNAQWEFAARGGTNTKSIDYNQAEIQYQYAWHSGNSNNKMHTVGLKMTNELGIYDMIGNVSEWCQDWLWR